MQTDQAKQNVRSEWREAACVNVSVGGSVAAHRRTLPLATGAPRAQNQSATDMVTLNLAKAFPEDPDALVALVRVCGVLARKHRLHSEKYDYTC